jgi:hypothetical protein
MPRSRSGLSNFADSVADFESREMRGVLKSVEIFSWGLFRNAKMENKAKCSRDALHLHHDAKVMQYNVM